LNEFIASALNSMKCPDCGKHPDVIATSSGVRIETCCCDVFRKSLIDEIKPQAGIYAKNVVEQTISEQIKSFQKLNFR